MTNLLDKKLNSQIEFVFGITVDKAPKKGKHLVFIPDIVTGDQPLMNFEILEQVGHQL